MGAREVANGAAWLDKEFPGWERKIDLGTLALDECQHCVCGQSLAAFVDENIRSGYDAAVMLGTGVGPEWAYSRDFNRAVLWAADHGFALKDEDSENPDVAFAALETLWRDLIKERFSTGNLSDEGGA